MITECKPSRKRALVIAGAGAALDFGAPSTSELTELVQKKVITDNNMRKFGCDQVFKRIDAELSAYLAGGAESVNFEHIFHCAQEILATTFEPTPRAFNEFRPILYPFFRRWTALDEKGALKELVRHLPVLLFTELSDRCASPRNLTLLKKFLKMLQKKYVTRIYTTNYDDFILQAAPNLYHGFDFTNGGGPKHFDPENFWASVDSDSVFHLHGSVHFGFPPPPHGGNDLNVLCWFNDLTEARLYSSYNGSEERRMDGSLYLPSVLITGFDKLSRMQQTPQAHYYASLARDAMVADVIFVIGSGLSDLHINARIAEGRRRRPSPPIVFIDRWEDSFLCETRWEKNRKETEMFHEFRMFMDGDKYRDNAILYGSGWTIAKDGSCAVWDRGFGEFLKSLNELPAVLNRLNCV